MIGLELTSASQNYLPGDQVEGVVRWAMDRPPQAVEVRLFWFTAGKGDRDVTVAQRIKTVPRAASGEKPFRFRLPHQPYSFSGKLISLMWALEAIATGVEETALLEIVVAPGGKEIVLPAIGS